MKIIKIISLILVFAIFTGINTSAHEGLSWYLKKRGNCKPGFPEESIFISEHNGFFLDEKSNSAGNKVIYLTFDAGYENGNIEKILDIMKDEEVQGAFFILSNLINKNPELVCRMVDEGHLVCNHTSNHKDISNMTKEEIVSNLETLEKKFETCTGKKMDKYFRFPEGKYSKEALVTVESMGYTTVFWSMAYEDWDNSKQLDKSKAMKKLLDNTHEGAIVLLHPTSSTNVQILRELIKTWRSLGYTFGSLNDLF